MNSTKKIDHPLRLAVGNHSAGSGKGCAMNVVSWENGDTTITDTPDCSDMFLSGVVHYVNDTVCTHRGDADLLCPACSGPVLDLAHRTVGTAILPSVKAVRVQALTVVRMLKPEIRDYHTVHGTAASNVLLLVRRWALGKEFRLNDLVQARDRVIMARTLELGPGRGTAGMKRYVSEADAHALLAEVVKEWVHGCYSNQTEMAYGMSKRLGSVMHRVIHTATGPRLVAWGNGVVDMWHEAREELGYPLFDSNPLPVPADEAIERMLLPSGA